jgi:hypothetical protein
LEAAFEASLITGRIYLNVLGVSKNRHDVLQPTRFQEDDVSAADLGGGSIDISTLTPDDISLFTGFLKMADKGAAHLTMPMQHPVDQTHSTTEWRSSPPSWQQARNPARRRH